LDYSQALFPNIDAAVRSPPDSDVLEAVVAREDAIINQDVEEDGDDDASILTISTFHTIKHIGDDLRRSAKVKARSAISHCNTFLKQYMPTKTEKKARETYVPLEQLVLVIRTLPWRVQTP
jgi:hypothetical protein